MAITVPNVVKVTGSGVTSVTTSSVTTTTGSTFVAWTTADDAVTINAPSDSKSNSYGTAKVTVSTGGGSSKQTVYVKENGTGGASHTLTFTFGAATYPTCFFIECAGAATASYDSGSLTSGASAAGSPFNRNSGGQAQANNAILAFVATDAGGTLTYTNSGYTVSQEQDGNNYWTGAIGRQIVSQTTAVTSSFAVSPGASNGGTITFAIKEASGGGGVTGTVAWTEANDTASLTGSVRVSGTTSWTEANDTAAVTGSVRVSGTSSWTESNDTAALTGTLSVSGAANWTEANDSASITGALTVSGSASWTEARDTAALTGTVGSSVSGSLSWTEANDTASVTGSLTVSGSVAWTESNDTASLAGQVTQPATGTIEWVEADDLWYLVGSSAANDGRTPGGSGGGPSKRKKKTYNYDYSSPEVAKYVEPAKAPVKAVRRKAKKSIPADVAEMLGLIEASESVTAEVLSEQMAIRAAEIRQIEEEQEMMAVIACCL